MSKRTMQEVQDDALQNLRLLIKEYAVDVIVDSPESIQQALGIDTPAWRAVRNKLVDLGRIELIANPKSAAYPAIRILKNENNEPVDLKESGWHLCWYKAANGEKVTAYHNLHDVDVPCVKAPGPEAFPPFKKGFNSSTLTDPGAPIKSNSQGFSGRSRATPEPPTPPSNTEDSLTRMFEEQRRLAEEKKANFKVVGTKYVELPNGDLEFFYVGNDGFLWMKHPTKPNSIKRAFKDDDSAEIEKYWETIRQPMTVAMRKDLGLTKKKKFDTASSTGSYKDKLQQEPVMEEFWFNPATREYFDDYGVLKGKDNPVWVYWVMFIPGVIMYCLTVLRIKWDNWYSEYKDDMQAKRNYERNKKANKKAREKEFNYLARKGRRIYGDPYALQEDRRPRRVETKVSQ